MNVGSYVSNGPLERKFEIGSRVAVRRAGVGDENLITGSGEPCPHEGEIKLSAFWVNWLDAIGWIADPARLVPRSKDLQCEVPQKSFERISFAVIRLSFFQWRYDVGQSYLSGADRPGFNKQTEMNVRWIDCLQ